MKITENTPFLQNFVPRQTSNHNQIEAIAMNINTILPAKTGTATGCTLWPAIIIEAEGEMANGVGLWLQRCEIYRVIQ